MTQELTLIQPFNLANVNSLFFNIIECHALCGAEKWCIGPLEADCVICPNKMFRNLEEWSCIERCPPNLHKIEMHHASVTTGVFRYCRGSNIFIDPNPSQRNVELGTLR